MYFIIYSYVAILLTSQFYSTIACMHTNIKIALSSKKPINFCAANAAHSLRSSDPHPTYTFNSRVA